MKHLAPLFSAMVITLILAGCGTSGKNFPVLHIGDIQNGVTTQSQILDWFNLPWKEGMRDGDPLWTYQFDSYNAVGDDKSKELVILFDQKNVVKAYRYASNMDD
jgi:hypothetical protein